LYLDTPEKRGVAAGAGIPFTHENLGETIESTLTMSDEERETWRFRAMKRVDERYSWDRVTTDYEKPAHWVGQGTARA